MAAKNKKSNKTPRKVGRAKALTEIPSFEELPAVLGTSDISTACEVTIQTVQSWIDRGSLKAFRTPGGHRRVKKEDFLNFLERFQFPLYQEHRTTAPVILMADNEKSNKDALVRAITKGASNATVATCGAGIDALIHIGLARPDIAILDVFADGLPGVSIFKKVRAFPELSQIKFIAIAEQKNVSEKEYLRKGASAVLTKPIKPAALTEAIREILETK